MRYDLFISYSTDPDYRLSKKIEAFLEGFHKLGEAEGKKLKTLSICRDGSNFKLVRHKNNGDQPDDQINHILETYLKESKYLLVLCSENACRSKYVKHEVDFFIRHNGEENILAAFTEGNNPGGQPEKYFNEHLREHKIHETICYDLRGFKASHSRSWSKVRDREEELTKLAAHLHGESIDDIMPLWKGEERKRERRQRRVNRFLWGLSTVMFAAFLVMAWLYNTINEQNQIITEEKDKSNLKSQITALASTAYAIKDYNRTASYLTVLEAYDSLKSKHTSELSSEQMILDNLLREHQINFALYPFYSYTISSDVRNVLQSKSRLEGSQLSLYTLKKDQNSIELFVIDIETLDPKPLKLIDNPAESKIVKFDPVSQEESMVLIYDENRDLKLIGYKEDKAITLDSIHLPDLEDFEYRRSWLYVATSSHWYKYYLNDTRLKLNTEIPKQDRRTVSQLKAYRGDILTYIADGIDLYRIDDAFRMSRRYRFNENRPISHYKFNGSRDRLAISRGRLVEVYELNNDRIINQLHVIDDHYSDVNSIDFDDGGRIMLGSSDKTATVWKGNVLDKRLIGHQNGITNVSFVKDNLALTTSEGKDIRFWDLSEIADQVVDLGEGNGVRTIESINSGEVSVTSYGGHAFLIDRAGNRRDIQQKWADGSQPSYLHMDHDEDLTIMAGMLSGGVTLSYMRNGKEQFVHITESSFPEGTISSLYGINDIEVNKSLMAIAVKNDLILLKLPDFQTKTDVLLQFQPEDYQVISVDRPIHSVAFKPDGSRLACGTSEGDIYVYLTEDLYGPRMEIKGFDMNGHVDVVNVLAFLDQGQYLISGSNDNTTKIWNLDGSMDSLHIMTLRDQPDDIIDIDVWGNQFLTVSNDHSVFLREFSGELTEKVSLIKHNTRVTAAAFLGENIVVSGDGSGTLKFWNIGGFEDLIQQRLPGSSVGR